MHAAPRDPHPPDEGGPPPAESGGRGPDAHRADPFAGRDPLHSADPQAWDELIEAVGPAGMLVAAASRMSAELRLRHAPEDLWQETLLHAWRDRCSCEWRGLRDFRRWLLAILDNRIHHLVESDRAAKRGGARKPVSFSALAGEGSTIDRSGSSGGGSIYAGPSLNTTPSRVASDREQARVMQAALASLPPEVCEVVRLRLFEELTSEEVATRLGLGLSAVKHRFLKGAADYRRLLRDALLDTEADARDATKRGEGAASA